MGKIINKIKDLYFADYKHREEFVLKSMALQVVDYLERNDQINKIQLFCFIRDNFDFSSLFELSQRLKNSNSLSHHYPFFKEYDFYIPDNKVNIFFENIEHRRIRTEFLAYLIRMKKDLLLIKDQINVNGLIDSINSRILKQCTIIYSNLNDVITLKEALGLFFVYPKDEAKKYYQLFLFNYLKDNKQYYEIAFNVDRYVYDLFMILDLDFIPDVKWTLYQDYKNDNLYEYNVDENISYDEIRNISRLKEYFTESIPLEDLEEKDLINTKKEIKDAQYVEYVLSKFFSDILGIQDLKIFKIFWTSCTKKNGDYNLYELNYARRVLNERVSQNELLIYNLIAIFKVLKDGDQIKHLPTKLPKILKNYFQENCNYSIRAIYDFLSREEINNNKFKLAYLNINDWFYALPEKTQGSDC